MNYITRTELAAAANVGITHGLSDAQLDAACAAASDTASAYLRGHYILPLTAWGSDLKERCCNIAIYDLLSRRGFAPDGADGNIRDRYKDAIKWFEEIRDGFLTIVATDSSTPDPDSSDIDSQQWAGHVITRPKRGW